MAKLFVRGRDVEEQILTICFSKETMTWEFISGNTPVQEELKKDQIISFLMVFIKKEKRFEGTAGELSEKLMAAGCPDVNPNVLSRKLKKYEELLLKEGISYTKYRSGDRRMIALSFSSEGAVDHNRHYRHVKGVKREAGQAGNVDFSEFLNEKPVFSLIGEGFLKRRQGSE